MHFKRCLKFLDKFVCSLYIKKASDRPIPVIPFHPHNIPIKKIVQQNWNILYRDPSIANRCYY